MPQFILDHGTPDAARAFQNLDAFTQGYIEAMFFTSTGHLEDGDLEDATVADLAPETLDRIRLDCTKFQADAAAPLAAMTGCRSWQGSTPDITATPAGRDFWYTRNGHGCGFWDGDWPEPHAGALDTIAKSFGEVDLYRGDDGKLYL